MEYENKVSAIRNYFGNDNDPDGKVPIAELKALTKDERDDLVQGIIAAGHTIKS